MPSQLRYIKGSEILVKLKALCANLSWLRFMANLNPFICQLDPVLHTFDHVRETSPFLLSTILAAAAKALNPSLQSTLRDHAETLFAKAFRRGEKSASHVQAILILTYWKEPEDTRAFVNVGLAIRVAMELGWHNLAVHPQPPGRSEFESRKARNIERTWLVLFVYDRSYNAAITMLELVADESNTSSLYFAQDSVHVMIAYAAVFLIKLVLSVPGTIRHEIEATAINSLRTASEILSQQAAPPNTGCALQSMFLANVLGLVEHPSKSRLARNTLQNTPGPLPGQRSDAYETPMQTTKILGRSSNETPQRISHKSNGHDAIFSKYNDSSLVPDLQNFDFDDNEMWSNMFASAGFAIDDGTFLPDIGGNYGPI
ncbi:hypothetical protein BLS_006017 [Venturia inaequalis]|uniref:Xylanolytic transcriptional activator regulatory domain-containing protein n=1 Tax=Venturia inaequalis TaxID=5025 RepID=A0A8H3YPB9_VENIN|nr:hypothetical protein BLS_006017 [Venturia inaequalis]